MNGRSVRRWALALAGAAAFAALGSWQLGRAAFKERRAADWAAAEREPAVPVATALDADAEVPIRRVRLAADLDAAHAFLLDNQLREGRGGVAAYVPARLADGRVLLVDLGWVETPVDRRVAPTLPPLPDRLVADGVLAPPPAPGIALGTALPDWRAGIWPRVLRVDPQALATALGAGLVRDRVFRPDPDPASGYVRERGPALGMSAEKHRGYAVQWFGLAIAAVVIAAVLQRRDSR